ncbi:MAG: inositol monophosphatase [Flammeovirgaceae bacterium]|nr:MAG: inositol monophosphatase [Flammeovirgaceae bacterium]
MNIDQFLVKVKSAIQKNLEGVIALRDRRSLKDDLSYVTDGDLFVQSLILDILKEESKVTIVTEESQAEVSHKEEEGFIVVIDPIDGTENFTSGLAEWGVSIACFLDYQHVGSLLGCPELNLWLKTGDNVERFNSRIRGLSSSLTLDELVKATQGHEYRILGCCVYNMINVIRGSFLSFENPKGANSWDILAGLNLALENNLIVEVDDKPYTGEYLQANRKYRFRVEHR